MLNVQKLARLVKKHKANTAWGLDIDGNALKAVKINQSPKGPLIEEMDVIEYPPLPPDVDFLQTAHIKEAIQTLLQKHYIAKTDLVLVSVPGQFALSRFTTVPPVDKRQLKNVISYEAKQQIPFDLREVVWDYQQLTEQVPDVDGIEIGLFASKRATLDHILTNVESFGFKPKVLQVSPLAISNFILFDQEIDGPAIVVSLEEENTDLIIINGRHLWLRSIPLSVVDADFVKEIQKSMEYYKSLRKETVHFKALLLTGSKFQDASNVKYIAENLAYEIKVLKALNKLTLSDRINSDYFHENLMGLSVAIGLALQGVGLGAVNTNLLPPERIKAAEISKKKPYALAALGCLTLSLIVQYGVLNARINYLNSAKEYSQKELKNVKDLEQKYKNADSLVQTNKSALDFISSIDSDRFFWVEALDKLLSLIPNDVSIQSIQSSWIGEDALKTSDTPKQVQPKKTRGTTEPETAKKLLLMAIKGESREPTIGFIEEHILKPIRDLTLFDQKVPAFKDVEIVPGSCRQVVHEDKGDGYISFEIRWIVKTQDKIQEETEALSLLSGTLTPSAKS